MSAGPTAGAETMGGGESGESREFGAFGAPADVVAAGAVLWRPAPGDSGGVEVALVHRPRYDDWSLPKGKVDPGESVPAAAVREVTEETGSSCTLGVRLGESRYRVPRSETVPGARLPEGRWLEKVPGARLREGRWLEKVVYFWAARAGVGESASNDFTPNDFTPNDFTPNDEVDGLRWLTPADAEELASHPTDRDVLRRFRALGHRPPRPLLLVRHAKAGKRESWDSRGLPDELRPLTPAGRHQAAALDTLLGLFGPSRGSAAPPLRCPQTIQPLADRLGLTIHREPLLGEDRYWREPDAALARLRSLAAGPGVAVVCSQGGVIPDLVHRLTGRPDPPSAKGSTWVLGFPAAAPTDHALTADYYPPPP